MGQNLRRRIELKFAAKAAFSVTNIKRTIWVLQDEFWKIGFFADLKSVKSKIAVLSSNLQVTLLSA